MALSGGFARALECDRFETVFFHLLAQRPTREMLDMAALPYRCERPVHPICDRQRDIPANPNRAL